MVQVFVLIWDKVKFPNWICGSKFAPRSGSQVFNWSLVFHYIFSLEVVFWLHAGIALSKSIYLLFHASYFSFIFPLRVFCFCPFCRVFFCFVFVYLGPVALWFEYNGIESLRYGLVLQDPLFSLYFSHFGTFCILYFILAISNNLSEQT